MKGLGNVLILGDSYSTFRGYNPEGYDVWYSEEDNGMTDVRAVSETWWHRLLSDCGGNLVRNSSFSGTTVCHTGYNGSDCRGDSFAGRLDRLVTDGFFEENEIDTFFILGLTNDCWAGSPVGSPMYEGWEEDDLYRVAPAFSYMLKRARDSAKDSRIIFIMNYGLTEELFSVAEDSCRHFGVEFLPLSEFEVNVGHPTVLGMKQIKEQVQAYLEKTI